MGIRILGMALLFLVGTFPATQILSNIYFLLPHSMNFGVFFLGHGHLSHAVLEPGGPSLSSNLRGWVGLIVSFSENFVVNIWTFSGGNFCS